jgi:hypothetical protein
VFIRLDAEAVMHADLRGDDEPDLLLLFPCPQSTY